MEKFSKEYIYQVLKETENTPFTFTDEDRQRALNNPSNVNLLKGLLEDGEYYRNMHIPTLEFSKFKLHDLTGERHHYDNEYFIRRKMLTTYSLLSWLYNKQEDIEKLEDIVWAICDEYTWSHPSHLFFKCLTELQKEDTYMLDLYASETSQALAETLTLVGDKISPIIKMRVEREIERRVFVRYENVTFLWKYEWATNWCSVCNSSTGIACLYLMKDLDRLANIIKMITDSLHTFYGSYPDDGACTEGMSYWDFGFGWLVNFIDVLKKRTAGKIDLFKDEKIHKMATFPNRIALGSGKCVGFADSNGGEKMSMQTGLISYLVRTYSDMKFPTEEYLNINNGKYDTLNDGNHANSRFSLTLRNLVWTEYDILSKCEEIAKPTSIFPYAQWYIANSINGVGIAGKGGHNDEAHNHNDIGCYHIYKNGKRMIADLGCPRYVSDYFMPNTRYTKFHCTTSRLHNVPVINGIQQKEGKKYSAKNVEITENGYTMDISGAYDIPELLSLIRDLKFDHQTGEVVVTDKFTFDKEPTSIVEPLSLMVKPIISDGEIIINVDGEIMKVLYDSKQFSVTVSVLEDTIRTGMPRICYLVELDALSPSKEYTVQYRIING